MKVVKFTALAALFLAVFIASIGVNIAAHEAGHYLAADSMGLDPQVGFVEPGEAVTGLLSADSNIAYVQYLSASEDVTGQDAAVAAAGPLVNLAIGCLGLLLYFSSKNNVSKMLLLVLITASFVSFGVNILPISPNDGFYIWNALLKI